MFKKKSLRILAYVTVLTLSEREARAESISELYRHPWRHGPQFLISLKNTVLGHIQVLLTCFPSGCTCVKLLPNAFLRFLTANTTGLSDHTEIIYISFVSFPKSLLD